jgi:glycosyltransferase involved in cell wall biosynthesis
MRIGLVAPGGTPVRQTGAGSIESLVWLLSHEFTKMGHDVTVFAIEGSQVDCELVPTLPGTYGSDGAPDNWHLCEWISLCRAVELSDRLDILHSHNYLYGLPLESLSRARMVHTLHVMPEDDAERLRSAEPDACVTAISNYQWSSFQQFRQSVVYHGIDASQFTFRSNSKNYLAYLGRFTPGKTPLAAIEIARELKMPLLMAGPRNDYFSKVIEPLVDGTSVKYVGPIGGSDRDELLGGASVFLYTNHEPEPFGLVMAEAMMCGTPVAALSVGAVPEIIDAGLTGCIAGHTNEMSTAVLEAISLDRTAIRRRAQDRFSAKSMAQRYLDIYEQTI